MTLVYWLDRVNADCISDVQLGCQAPHYYLLLYIITILHYYYFLELYDKL